VAALKHWRGDEVNAPPGNATRALCAAPSNTEPYVREYILPHFTTAVFSLPPVLAVSLIEATIETRPRVHTNVVACVLLLFRSVESIIARAGSFQVRRSIASRHQKSVY